MNEVGKNNEENILSGAVMLNPMFDKTVSYNYMESYAFGFISRITVKVFKIKLLEQTHMFPSMEKEYGIDMKDIYSDNCTTTHEFIDKFIAKMFGCANAFEYYEAIKLIDKIQNFKTKTLFISSKDDVLCGDKPIPKEEVKQNENTYLMVTRSGSHLAFYNKLFSSKQWFMIPAFRFFNYLHSLENDE